MDVEIEDSKVYNEVEEQEEQEEEVKVGRGSTDLLSVLREKREALSKERHLDLEIPGYSGLLYARFTPVPWEVQEKIGKKMNKSKNPRKTLLAQADYLIASCSTILVVEEGEEEPKPMHEVVPDFEEPVGFDERLAQALDIEATTARQVLFGVYQNDSAILSHNNEVGVWMAGATDEDDADF